MGGISADDIASVRRRVSSIEAKHRPVFAHCRKVSGESETNEYESRTVNICVRSERAGGLSWASAAHYWLPPYSRCTPCTQPNSTRVGEMAGKAHQDTQTAPCAPYTSRLRGKGRGRTSSKHGVPCRQLRSLRLLSASLRTEKPKEEAESACAASSLPSALSLRGGSSCVPFLPHPPSF